MRIPNDVHRSQSWRIHDLVPDFRLEDVWTLPAVQGGAEDFGDAVEMTTSFDPAHAESLPTRFLWGARDRLGAWFGLGRISTSLGSTASTLPLPGSHETSLAERLPDDLRGTAADAQFEHLPFTSLYRTNDEFAAEVSNQTVHAVMHLAWVDQGGDRYQGQMAVYVKPRGRFGTAYMAFIKPFRYAIVYPALERQMAHTWSARPHP